MRASVHLLDAVVVANGFPLISGTSLTIESGTVTVIKGANGAGKTSLLQLIGGLLPLSNGEGVVAGVDLNRHDRREVRRHVGWLGHEGSFYEDLTVAENLAFACAALSIDGQQIPEALERVGLLHRLETQTKDLSAGQRRRVGLAWLLLRRPEIWLLDEPYASIDSQGREFLEGVISDAARAGATVLVSSHDELDLGKQKYHTITMAGGRVVTHS
jgi:heme exporter protein A